MYVLGRHVPRTSRLAPFSAIAEGGKRLSPELNPEPVYGLCVPENVTRISSDFRLGVPTSTYHLVANVNFSKETPEASMDVPKGVCSHMLYLREAHKIANGGNGVFGEYNSIWMRDGRVFVDAWHLRPHFMSRGILIDYVKDVLSDDFLKRMRDMFEDVELEKRVEESVAISEGLIVI